MKYVAYYRVSTQKQGQSGLGLDAQRTAVKAHVRAEDELVAEYTEVESGRRADRPQLASAMRHAKRVKGTLVIAKLDRLARNVRFLAQLMEEGVPLAFCDMPNANEFTLHIMAAVAQHEAKQISQRTKDALTAAKARGVKLGGPKAITEAARQRGTANAKANSDLLWARLEGDFRAARDSGCSTIKEVGAFLEARRVTTPRGTSTWSTSMVHRGFKRFGIELGAHRGA